jgi:hypothetical protein
MRAYRFPRVVLNTTSSYSHYNGCIGTSSHRIVYRVRFVGSTPLSLVLLKPDQDLSVAGPIWVHSLVTQPQQLGNRAVLLQNRPGQPVLRVVAATGAATGAW